MEEERLQFGEPLEFIDIRGGYNTVEAHVLEGDLLDGLLEIRVVEDLKSVTVDKKFVVAFDLSVAGLYEALAARLLPPFVSVQAQSLDALHLILPLLRDNL